MEINAGNPISPPRKTEEKGDKSWFLAARHGPQKWLFFCMRAIIFADIRQSAA